MVSILIFPDVFPSIMEYISRERILKSWQSFTRSAIVSLQKPQMEFRW